MEQRNDQFSLSLFAGCLFILSINFACNNSIVEFSSEDGVSEIKVNRELAKDIQINEAIQINKWVCLETSPNSIIGTVSCLRYLNNNFILACDTFNLFRYSQNGNLLNRIGRKGQGPGEYRFVFDFTIDSANRMVEVFDHIKKQMLFYNIEGQFDKQIDVGIRNMKIAI